MNPACSPDERTRRLIVKFIDGEMSTVESAELNQLLQSDVRQAEQVVDQLLLDSLLSEELGTESLAALVDLVADETASGGSPTAATGCKGADRLSRGSRRLWQSLGGVAVVAALLLAFLVGRWESSALANAATVVRAAMEAHARPVERVYMVQTERSATAEERFNSPRDVRVATQGDRFYVEMNHGKRRWFWGLDANGSIWLTLGPRRAIVVEPDECGVPLQYLSNLYTLNLESMLQHCLKHCALTHEDGPGDTHSITATPRRRWHNSWLRKATIDVDRETKAVRRLVMEREVPQHGTSTVTFTLVDSHSPDESKYRPEGHLIEPFQLLTRETQPDKRRELVTAWFGPAAERWIVTVPQPDAIQNLSSESARALRERVNQLFEALQTGNIEGCVNMTDPQVVEEQGRGRASAFFRSVSRLVRASRVQPADRVIKSITLIESGQAARVDIEVTLNGAVQPLGFEIWTLVDGRWYYRETLK